MNDKCKFCNPTNEKAWKEDSFYGFQCSTCTNGNTAFVVLNDHRANISDQEMVEFEKDIQKHYPDLVPKGDIGASRSGGHWFAFLVRKK